MKSCFKEEDNFFLSITVAVQLVGINCNKVCIRYVRRQGALTLQLVNSLPENTVEYPVLLNIYGYSNVKYLSEDFKQTWIGNERPDGVLEQDMDFVTY